ncbi:META domain-containing protein [Hufsiella ginkgonis]|uniref:META domain-containing protein n=1 Tax=Hufsiella ginkgonis TaxID=2695274 RepID=A0A7K1XWP3_9SPHI|nr:META domain-containing protein [Hufsiella ginkgonis]MXV15401.1 META domain-containing protein [Hufsiella ginkgonis]
MKAIRLLLPIVVFISSCKVLSGTGEQPVLEGTHWRLIALNQKPVEPSEQAFLEFKEGKASGKAACNSFSSEYELKRSHVKLGPIMSTKMFCDGLMDQENQIVQNLQKVTRFEIRYGLLYLYESNNLLMTYKR